MYFTTIFVSTIVLFILVPTSLQQGNIVGNNYGALSSRCSSKDREDMNRCEGDAIRDWDIRDTDIVSTVNL